MHMHTAIKGSTAQHSTAVDTKSLMCQNISVAATTITRIELEEHIQVKVKLHHSHQILLITKQKVKLMIKEMLRGKKIAGKYLIDVYFHGIECTDIPFTVSKKSKIVNITASLLLYPHMHSWDRAISLLASFPGT